MFVSSRIPATFQMRIKPSEIGLGERWTLLIVRNLLLGRSATRT